jgi:hypothetical protein
MKYTKGKWFTRKCADGEIDIASQLTETMESPSIAIALPVISILAKIGGGTTEANARLMASSPVMLEALQEIEKFAKEEFPTSSALLKHSSPSYDLVASMKYDLLQRILIITHKVIAKAEGQEPPVITGDKDTDELLEIERCNQEDKPWEMGTDQEGILMLDCEHKNKPIYQPEEKDTGIPESYTCDDCGKEFDIPEPDFDLMNKE